MKPLFSQNGLAVDDLNNTRISHRQGDMTSGVYANQLVYDGNMIKPYLDVPGSY